MESDSKSQCCACCEELRFKIKALEDICLNLPEHVDYQREVAEARAKKEKKERQRKANLKAKAELLEEDCEGKILASHRIPNELLKFARVEPKKHWFRKMTKSNSQRLYVWQECFKCGIKMDKVGFC